MRSFFLLCVCAAASIFPAVAPSASYEPADCQKADIPALATICSNYELGQAEARMATLYGIAASLIGMGQRGDLVDAQRAWLSERDLCGHDTQCLRGAYARRIRQLDTVIAGIASRGPY